MTQLHVEGYRSLVNVELPMRPLAVMIGPNGSGKTSLLEVFQLLKEAAQENLAKAVEHMGGLNAALPRVANGPDRLKISLEVDAESKTIREPMRYRFELLPRDTGYVISLERLEWQRDKLLPGPFYYISTEYGDMRYYEPDRRQMVRPTWDYHGSELALAQVPRMYAEPESLRSALSRTQLFSFLDVGRRSVIRLPQSLTPTSSPGPNGENLYSALYNLSSAPDGRTYRRIEEVLQIAFPGFRELKFPVVGAGQITMAWYQDGLSGPLYPGELSEGTLRFLWLITVLLSPEPSPITLIDEPEVSLHPELLKLLAGLLQDAACRGQVIVATHSTDLVRWLQPDEVLVLDKTDGQTSLTWADSLDLEEWLREYTLGELWLMGTLGGRP